MAYKRMFDEFCVPSFLLVEIDLMLQKAAVMKVSDEARIPTSTHGTQLKELSQTMDAWVLCIH